MLDPTDKLLTAKDLATLLRLQTKTVLGLARKKIIPSFKLTGGSVRFRKEDVLAALARR